MTECWYCQSTEAPLEAQLRGVKFTVCRCGATSVEFPYLRLIMNGRGGVKTVVLPPAYQTTVTANDRQQAREHALAEL